nr:NTP transferase domain-containing protein [Rufibacter sp. LB8]
MVLSGGKSERMGQDKSLLPYHGLPQRDHALQLLGIVCDKVFLSLRPGQQENQNSKTASILDSQEGLRGPLNGILSAMQQHPQAAWLVLACDLPLVTAATLKKLIQHRNPEKIATAYAVNGSDLPEPLVAIWEPTAYALALAFTQTGKTCPRKFLLGQDIQLVHPAHDEELFNANFPEDATYAKAKLTHDA